MAEKTNNPNATPTATDRPVATVKTQEQIAREKAAQGTTMEDLQALFGGQMNLLKQAQQGQVNPVTGTRSMTRRTMSGAIEDPNAPTGLAWFDAFGPNRPSVAARQAALDAQRSTVPAGMKSQIEQMKEQQRVSGTRTAFDDTNAMQTDNRGKVVQTPGSDVRVAYDQNGMPVGFSGAMMANAPMTSGGVPIGGFQQPVPSTAKFGAGTAPGASEQEMFRAFANNLAADQSIANARQGEVVVGPIEPAPTNDNLPYVAPTPDTTGVLGYQKAAGEGYTPADMLTAGVRRVIGQPGRQMMDNIANWLANLIGDAGAGTKPPTTRPVSPPIAGEVDAYGYPIPKNY
jgi:hypothetical protein